MGKCDTLFVFTSIKDIFHYGDEATAQRIASARGHKQQQWSKATRIILIYRRCSKFFANMADKEVVTTCEM